MPMLLAMVHLKMLIANGDRTNGTNGLGSALQADRPMVEANVLVCLPPDIEPLCTAADHAPTVL